MTVTMKDVFSSHVNKIGYNDVTGELIVEWDSGRVSAYAGVPAELADEISRNWSVGSMLNDTVKGKYEHRYLR